MCQRRNKNGTLSKRRSWFKTPGARKRFRRAMRKRK